MKGRKTGFRSKEMSQSVSFVVTRIHNHGKSYIKYKLKSNKVFVGGCSGKNLQKNTIYSSQSTLHKKPFLI